MLVSDPHVTILLNGSGDAIQIDEGVVAIGSGGLYAQGNIYIYIYSGSMCTV